MIGSALKEILEKGRFSEKADLGKLVLDHREERGCWVQSIYVRSCEPCINPSHHNGKQDWNIISKCICRN
uniref:Uncharacterized protein n=1 Tax=Rhizophora mucronata TaxID=61149 RepID=A0A2P2QTH6_RHIMU